MSKRAASDVYSTQAEDETGTTSKRGRLEDQGQVGRSVLNGGREDDGGDIEDEGDTRGAELSGSIVCAEGSKLARGKDPDKVRDMYSSGLGSAPSSARRVASLATLLACFAVLLSLVWLLPVFWFVMEVERAPSGSTGVSSDAGIRPRRRSLPQKIGGARPWYGAEELSKMRSGIGVWEAPYWMWAKREPNTR